MGYIPLWLVILVAFRDLTIVGGALLEQTITQSFKSRPLMLSKVNTAAQIFLVVALLGALLGLFAYATYDLTNLAVMKGFTTKIAIIDMVWGTVLTASVSGITAAIGVRLLGK